MFAAKTYITRRNLLAQHVQEGVLLFLGNTESPMNYADNTYHFRQDSTFLYYFGLDLPCLGAVLDAETGNTILFGDNLTIEQIVWMGHLPTLESQGEKVGITDVRPFAQLANVIQDACNRKRKIHYLPPYRGEHILMLHELLGVSLASVTEGVSEVMIRGIVAQRATKSDEEIAEIEKAVNITGEMHRAAMKAARPGKFEQEIAGLVEGIALSGGGALSFPIILTIHGETLHNHYHGNRLEEGHMVLHDSGAETVSHYAGDITRTFPAGSHFTAQQKEMYELVLRAQDAAVARIKPGVYFRDVHLTACRTLLEGLKEMGFVRGNLDDAVAAGVHTLFMQCGLGHMMGMDVHDMGNLGENFVGYTDTIKRDTRFGFRSLRMARALEPGFVMTVEPGIYFIPVLIDQWAGENKLAEYIDYANVQSYRGFGGIRVEDDYLITANGNRRLGQPIPRTIAEIEAVRNG